MMNNSAENTGLKINSETIDEINNNSPIRYGKFNSLTLINWNGFFARTFELDQLVTTLSGGNGAGKSTTMAGFVTALIPDLTLLHFRNTTEAGATGGSRDKGLYGKLKPGICYSLLDVINSKNQRIICGVRLQQIAGRDKKVDIKPFILQGLEKNLPLTEVITERLDERKARVLSLAEIKERIDSFDGVIFKQFNSISDYHSMMFDFGILPKRLRSSSDRSKYYRLIEASLYGGISSAITKSLRDYLLPENTGVRKAFQDMESALRENRMTLEAIRVTQSDRDLFKHLITESTHYVSADYMRHSNQRMNQIETLLGLRKALFSTKKELFSNQNNYIETAESLQERSKVQADLDVDFQSANDYLNLVQTAFRQQEKIDNYQVDVDELREKIFEQTEIVEQANEQYLAYQDTVDGTEKDVDEIKTQLSDYQQALDAKQTRTVQYQQALQALDNARKLCNLPNLTAENAQEELAIFNEKELEVTETVLQLEQKLSVANAAVNQFDQAYRLVVKLVGEVARSDAWKMAKQVLKDWASHSYQSEKVDQLQWQFNELEQRLSEQKEAEILLASFNKKIGYSVDYDDLDELKETLSAKLDESNNIADENNEKRLTLKQEFEQIDIQIQQYRQKTPIWLKAQDELNDLRDKLDVSLSSSQEVTEAMQSLLEKEREIATKRDQIVSKREQLNQKINQLNQPNGADDSRLNTLAERFNGVLLSEIYEDVTIDDAPYFSALYGPARHAIVVPDLASVKDQLNDLTDCPDDLYFIEGDASSFDASVFNSEELNQAVLVKTSDRQCRYSRFPELPLFGRAAREKHLDTLIQMRDELNEQYAIFSFDLQKLQRVEKNVSQFIGQYLAVAFDINPESEAQRLSARRNEIERELQSVVQLIQQNQQKILELKDQLVELNKLLSSIHLLADDGLADRTNEIEDALIQAKNSASYVKQNQNIIAELEPLVNLLQSDPNQHETLRQQFDDITAKQREIKKQIFALKEVIQRRPHFNYTDSVSIEESNTDLTSELRHRLEKAEKARSDAKEQMRYYQEQYHQYNGTLMSLKSAFDTKNDVLNDLKKEVSEMGVKVDAIVAEKARLRRDDLHHQITENRQLCSSLEKKLTVLNSEISQLQRKLKQIEKDYKIQREQVVEIKKGWCLILRTVKENGIERRLNRRELAYLSSDELRSMSDKALGALRLAVSNNEHLRDVLRLSEDIKRPERKIQFYLAVYQHLRERIRQDIVKTDDPIEAIEQMEIELSRLTEELTSREQQLAISAKSVSNIIRKTIQREENRIRMLNQGLQSVSFGQVNGVRLNVTIREAHSILLEALSAQSDDHQDLFDNSRMTFSEALAKLYQRLNPHVEMGQRSAQNIGEELLDYRNYLDLDIEVHRGADGWLRAESGALSTGEAIGTGMSILLMVIQSWEEESKRLRNKDILPCRLLFLDEAARLDAKSIATLFELCEKLEMQLIIAAPENISPEKGTTYKLVRKVVNNNEFVHVVGLKGFA